MVKGYSRINQSMALLGDANHCQREKEQEKLVQQIEWQNNGEVLMSISDLSFITVELH